MNSWRAAKAKTEQALKGNGMTCSKHLFLFVILSLLSSQAWAADPATLERVHRISLEEYQATLPSFA